MAKGFKTGGRKKGSKNRTTERLDRELARIRAEKAGRVAPEELTALKLLQQVYRDASVALDIRLQAAGKAIGYESPALAATKLDAGDDLKKVAQMMAAAASSFDEKINAVAFATHTRSTEDAADEPLH